LKKNQSSHISGEFRQQNLAHIDFLTFSNHLLKIEGFISIFDEDIKAGEIIILLNDEQFAAKRIPRDLNTLPLGNTILSAEGFVGEIAIEKNMSGGTIQIGCQINNKFHVIQNISFGMFAPLGTESKYLYWFKDGCKFTTNGKSIKIKKCNMIGHFSLELRCWFALILKRDIWSKLALGARFLYFVMKPFSRKNIWLISDRINKADDNGEAFFRYVSQKKDKHIQFYFAIKKKSPDFSRLKQYGKVINFHGMRHLCFILLGGTTVSSHRDYTYTNPFGKARYYIKDLLQNTKYVYLRHGVIHNDLSGWLNRYNKNFDIFTTSTKPEYHSIFEYNYYYPENQVRLTGSPRHDLLENNSKKYITIMPTWRKYLVSPLNRDTGIRTPNADFEKSEYFLFYNTLLNDENLIRCAQDFGYTLCFMLHPNMQSSANHFKKHDNVFFFNIDKSYRKIFSESDLIVTDYSSVAFDFAYLRKPLIYCQFDREEFFKGDHVYTKGYFDYERDGFGEVEITLEGTIARITEYMKHNCELKDEYCKRIDSTFAFHDKENCKRVYDVICDLQNKKDKQ
jgi:CDP-glycerol glycerophosphotransferase (TagB/SpsB family)